VKQVCAKKTMSTSATKPCESQHAIENRYANRKAYSDGSAACAIAAMARKACPRGEHCVGALAEGADVPRGVQLRVFPDTVVQKLPKVKGYKFFTAENRVAIADPQGAKVQLVIEQRR